MELIYVSNDSAKMSEYDISAPYHLARFARAEALLKKIKKRREKVPT